MALRELEHYDLHGPYHPGSNPKLEVIRGGKTIIISDKGKIDTFKETYFVGLDQALRVKRARIFLNHFTQITNQDIKLISNPESEDEMLGKITYELEDEELKVTTVEHSYSNRALGKIFVASELDATHFQRIALKHARGHGKFIFDVYSVYSSEKESFWEETQQALEDIKKGTFKRIHLF